VTYTKPGGLLERAPIPRRLRGTLRGVVQTSSALRSASFAGLFFLTHNPAVFQPRALSRHPAVLWTDVTPLQLDRFADAYDHPVGGSALLSRLKYRAVQSTFRRAALCVGWSNWARKSFVDDYAIPEHKTAVVCPGIDLTRWDAAVGDQDQERPRLLFVGGHFRRKGGDLLLDVFRKHFKDRCELDLVTRDEVEPETGVRVHRGLSTESPELKELYRRASVFVLPTRSDCYSIASLEAMASGLPVVVSDVGGIEDIVAEGETGFLTKPNDGAQLRTALDALLEDAGRRRGMGNAGRKLVEARFDSRKTAADIVGLLDRVAGGAITTGQ
jgi:glycosyltransferase involved in cell wall biosynthesis